ncbi:hypothetical protein [Priestia megaterium]|uniref:hypothetical protein n=1 Tax=Priestia megaterium TaxID=1404 RepID=UPI0030007ABC
MNGLYFHDDYNAIMTTDLLELEATQLAKKVVEEHILNQRQKHMDKDTLNAKITFKAIVQSR